MRFKRTDLVLLDGDRMGEIRYVGHVKGYKTKKQLYGICLTKGEGEHDGVYQKKRYFKCPKGKGIFVPESHVKGKYKPPEREAAAKPERTKPRTTFVKTPQSEFKGSDSGGPTNRPARPKKPLNLPKEYRISSLDKVLVGVVNFFSQNRLGDPNVAPINQKPILPEISALFSKTMGCQILLCKDPAASEDFIEQFTAEAEKSNPDLVCLFVFGRASLLKCTLEGRIASEATPLFSVPDERKIETEEGVFNNNVEAIYRATPVLVVGDAQKASELSVPKLIQKLAGGSSPEASNRAKQPRLFCACLELGDVSKHGRPLDVAEDWAQKYRPPTDTVASCHFYETHQFTHCRDRFVRRMLQTFDSRPYLTIEQILAASKTIVDRNTARERAVISALLPKALYLSSIEERSETGGVDFMLDQQDVPPYTMSDIKYTFDEYDGDKDGKLNRKEFESALEDIHYLFDRELAKKIYDEINAGAKGSQKKGIDYQEFSARLPDAHNDFDPMWHRLLHNDDADDELRVVERSLEKKIGGLNELLQYVENKQGSWKLRVQAMELALEKMRKLDRSKLDKVLKQAVAVLTIQLNPKIRFEIVRAACLTLAELALLFKDKMGRYNADLCTTLFNTMAKSRDPLIVDSAFNCMRCLLTFLSDDKHGAVFTILGNACADSKFTPLRKLSLELLGVYLEHSLDLSKTAKLKNLLSKGLKDRDQLVQRASMVNIVKLGYLEPLVAEELLRTCTQDQKQTHAKLKSALSLAQAALISPKGATMETLSRLKVQKPSQRPRALSSLETAADLVKDAFDTYANANEKLKYVVDINTGFSALELAMKPAKPSKDEYKALFLKHAFSDKSLDYAAFEKIFEMLSKSEKDGDGFDADDQYEIKAPSSEDLANHGYSRRLGLAEPLRAPPGRSSDGASVTSEDLSKSLSQPLLTGAAPARTRGGRNRRRGGVVNLQSGQLQQIAAATSPTSAVITDHRL